MHAVIVSARVKPERRQQFLAAIEDHSTCSARDEPGCLRFDVLQDRADPDHYYFVDLFQDEEAAKVHASSPHRARWREASRECLAEPTSVTRCDTVF